MVEFRAMVWQWAPGEEGRHAGTLHSVHEFEAGDVSAAAVLVLQQLSEQREGQDPPGARMHAADPVPVRLGERLLVDVQRKDMPVEHKLADEFATGARGEWFIVSGTLPDLDAVQVERAEALMSDRFPDVRFSSEPGSVAYAVSTVAVLADEAIQDVEDALVAIGAALGVEELMPSSGSCGRVGDDRPSSPELETALREAHEQHRQFEEWQAERQRLTGAPNFVLCERRFDDSPLKDGRAKLLDVLRGHSGDRALATYDEVDAVVSRQRLGELNAGAYMALNVSEDELDALRSHWDELEEGGLRLIGPAFMLDAEEVRATFERENVDGVEERLDQLRSQGRLIDGRDG